MPELVGKYYPYGQDRSGTPGNGTEKFATYTRDAETGLDYADQRYHTPGQGRFLTPDPAASGLNWYAYAGGDPVNTIDPTGQEGLGMGFACDPGTNAMCSMMLASQGFSGDPFGDGGGEGGGGPAGATQSVFAYDLGNTNPGNFLTFSSAYDLNYGAPGFGPIAPPTNSGCVQNAIMDAAGARGLDLSLFSSSTVQIVGTPNPAGGVYGETELNLFGTPQAVTGLIDQMCPLGFFNNAQCPGGAGSTPLVGGPHTEFTGNFRSPSLTDSLQVNTNVRNGTIQLDVDPFNPASTPPVGVVLHGVLQVIPNKITGSDNTYGCP